MADDDNQQMFARPRFCVECQATFTLTFIDEWRTNMSLGCPRCGSLVTDVHEDGCTFPRINRPDPDNLTDAIIRVIDGWRERNPDLTYFETVTVIEGIARMLRRLRDDSAGPPLREHT